MVHDEADRTAYKPLMCPSCRIIHNTIQEHLLAHFDANSSYGKVLAALAKAIPDGVEFERVYHLLNDVSLEQFKRGQQNVLDGGYAASQAAAAFRRTW